MTFDWRVKFGDILTSLTILVSVSALIFSWSKDRLARETEQADRVREAAASALMKLDRWQFLNESLYQNLQPVFIVTSEKLQEEFNLVKARDFLWKSINDKRIDISSKILEEKVYTSYVGLLAHFPKTRGQYIEMFDKLRSVEAAVSGQFLEASQHDVLALRGKEKNYSSALLGNALRTTAAKFKEKPRTQSTKIIRPVRDSLFTVIAKSNEDILRSSRAMPDG